MFRLILNFDEINYVKIIKYYRSDHIIIWLNLKIEDSEKMRKNYIKKWLDIDIVQRTAKQQIY